MDVIAAQERGFKNVVACMGTTVTSQQLQTISTVLPDDPDNPPSIVLCLDADQAGQQATLRGLQIALSEFGRGSARNNTRSSPIDIRVAGPVVSEHGEPKDPDDAIRNNGAEWIASIDQADEIIDFVIRSSLSRHNTATENGLDAALNEVEPYFESIPANTIYERGKLSWLGEQVGIDFDGMIHMLKLKRSARETIQNASNPDRNTRRTPTRKASRTTPSFLPARWEYELLACMLRYDYAIDHAATAEPDHFIDPVRMRVFKALTSAANVDECLARIQGDDEALALVNQLKEFSLSPTAETIEDQATIIQIAERCATRTHEEYLIRNKKREVQLAKENGNMFSDEEEVTISVQTNLKINKLKNPQQAASSH